MHNATTDSFPIIFVVIGITIILLLYFLPAIVAYKRKHRNATAILVLNILLGWTLLGWAIGLIWAFMKSEQEVK